MSNDRPFFEFPSVSMPIVCTPIIEKMVASLFINWWSYKSDCSHEVSDNEFMDTEDLKLANVEHEGGLRNMLMI